MMEFIEKVVIRTQCTCYYCGEIWFFSNEINALFKINPQTMQSKYVTSIEGYPINTGWLFTKMIPYKDRLILIPFVAKRLIIYCPNTKETKYIEFNLEDDSPYFVVSEMFDQHSIILFPAIKHGYYYIYNLEDEMVTRHRLESNMFINGSDKTLEIVSSGVMHDDRYIINILKSNRLMYFKNNSCSLKFDNITTLKKRVCAIEKYNEKYFIALDSTGDNLFMVDYDGKITEEYCLGAVHGEKLYMFEELMGYSAIKNLGNELVMAIPVKGNDLIILYDGEVIRLKLNWEIIKTTCDNAKPFSDVIVDQNYYYLMPYQSSTIVQISIKNYTIEYFERPDVSTQVIYAKVDLYTNKENKNLILQEGDITIEDYIKVIRKNIK